MWEAFPEITDVFEGLSLGSVDTALDDLPFTTKLDQLLLLVVHDAGFSWRRLDLSRIALQSWMHYCNIYIVLFYKAAAGAKLEIYSSLLLADLRKFG